jgi:hypothetical protein
MVMMIDNDNDNKRFDFQTLDSSITSKTFPIPYSLFQLRFPNVKVQQQYTLCQPQK